MVNVPRLQLGKPSISCPHEDREQSSSDSLGCDTNSLENRLNSRVPTSQKTEPNQHVFSFNAVYKKPKAKTSVVDATAAVQNRNVMRSISKDSLEEHPATKKSAASSSSSYNLKLPVKEY